MTPTPLSHDPGPPREPDAHDETLELGLAGFSYADLHEPVRLEALYREFLDALRSEDAGLAAAYGAWRAAPDALTPTALSDMLLAVAPHVSRFVARLFRIEDAVATHRATILSSDPIFRFKVDFVRRRAAAKFKTPGSFDPVRAAGAGSVIVPLRSAPGWPFAALPAAPGSPG